MEEHYEDVVPWVGWPDPLGIRRGIRNTTVESFFLCKVLYYALPTLQRLPPLLASLLIGISQHDTFLPWLPPVPFPITFLCDLMSYTSQ
jgi:hypothetical protein